MDHYPYRELIDTGGKSIDRDEIYRYTNGRFLVDEKNQCGRRHVEFDFDRLCEIASSVGESKCRIRSVDKMEGGFSKALRMTKEDGTEVIAKIPCPNAGPASFTTASEVAVMKYVKSQTSIPVPEIFAWNSDPSNPVGAEYIIMGKAPGVQLFKVWDAMDGSAKMAFIKQLTKLESQLASIQFPAYGGLYLAELSHIREDLRAKIPSDIDAFGSYFVGPASDRSWMVVHDEGTMEHDFSSGPWPSLSSYGETLAKREIYRILNTPRQNVSSIYYGTASEQISLLQTAITAIKSLEIHPLLANHSQPRIWHTDLHMGNIFVSEQDPSQILSFIDWQSIQVAPIFLQARWPEFVTPPKDYETGFVHPKLPDNFEQLDPEEQKLVKYQWGLANRAKVYETSNYLNDRAHHDAMNVPRVFRELFLRCGETWEVGCVPLRACLIELFTSWEDMKLHGTCPFSFKNDELSTHEVQFNEYQEHQKVRDFAKEYLGTDDEGWISPELDFAEVRTRNRNLFNLFLDQMAGGKSPEEARKMWPFLEDV